MNPRIGRTGRLVAHHEIHPLGKTELRLCRIVEFVGPEILLVVDTRPVEHTDLQVDRNLLAEFPAQGGSDIADAAHLLGDERTVRKILRMGGTVSIDGKRDPHKSDRETESLIEFGPQIRIDHLDLSLVREVDLHTVSQFRIDLAGHAEAGVANLEAGIALAGLVLEFGPERSQQVDRHGWSLFLLLLCSRSCRNFEMSLNSDSFVLVIILIFVIILIVVLTTVALVTPPVLLRKLALPDVLVLPGIRPHRSGTIVVIRIDIFFLFRVIRTLRLRLDDHLFQIVLHGYRFHIHPLHRRLLGRCGQRHTHRKA